MTAADSVTSYRSGRKAKKLGSGGNPKELEVKYKVAEAMKEVEKAS